MKIKRLVETYQEQLSQCSGGDKNVPTYWDNSCVALWKSTFMETSQFRLEVVWGTFDKLSKLN